MLLTGLVRGYQSKEMVTIDEINNVKEMYVTVYGGELLYDFYRYEYYQIVPTIFAVQQR